MKIIHFTVGPLNTNSYLLYLDGQNDGILVDAGGDYDKVCEYSKRTGVAIKHVLLTHGHFDHVGAVAQLQKDGAKVYIHENDKNKVQTEECLCGFSHIKIKTFSPDVLVSDGEELELCGLKIKVIHTPGHTSGSVCYVIEDCIFSGDTLFDRSYGRVDLGDGDIKVLANSIKNKLFTLDGEYQVLPGHESFTDLSDEKVRNPILYYV